MKFASTRRRFMSLVAAAPIAGREVAARTLSGIGVMGADLYPKGSLKDAIGLSDAPSTMQSGTAGASGLDYQAAKKLRELTLRAALANKTARGELESILYEDERRVGALDPDLAANRSLSFMAKVTFQRQRNVARAIENSLLETSPYNRIRQWGERALMAAGIKV